MATTRTYGRTSWGGGTRQPTQQRKSQSPAATIGYPLAQTLPSVARAPRFRPAPVSPVPHPGQGPNQSPTWRGGNAFDDEITRSRYPIFQRGTEKAGRISSQSDPPSDGPIRPSLRLINRTWNWQVGTGTAYADDPSRGYTGVGEQGSGWSIVYGGATGFYRLGPGGQPVGDPNAGPSRVWAGPPHGYHTEYPPQGAQTQNVAFSRPQMIAPRVDRLSNSRIAGQNYSQWTQHQGGGQQ